MTMTQPILLVEDDENDVLFMKIAMEESGISNILQVAEDGQQALEYLEGAGKYADRQKYPLPCLLLLDLKLPYVPGLEVLRKIRGDCPFRKTIVLVLTSSREESDIEQAYSLGANAYLLKPPSIDRLNVLMRAVKDFWLSFNMPPSVPKRD
jgi:CheY-like chemotaxis protein